MLGEKLILKNRLVSFLELMYLYFRKGKYINCKISLTSKGKKMKQEWQKTFKMEYNVHWGLCSQPTLF